MSLLVEYLTSKSQSSYKALIESAAEITRLTGGYLSCWLKINPDLVDSLTKLEAGDSAEWSNLLELSKSTSYYDQLLALANAAIKK